LHVGVGGAKKSRDPELDRKPQGVFMNNQPSIKDTTSPESQPLLDPKSKILITQEQPAPADTMTAPADTVDDGGALGSFAPMSVKGGHD
jgi:hypothetical protein